MISSKLKLSSDGKTRGPAIKRKIVLQKQAWYPNDYGLKSLVIRSICFGQNVATSIVARVVDKGTVSASAVIGKSRFIVERIRRVYIRVRGLEVWGRIDAKKSALPLFLLWADDTSGLARPCRAQPNWASCRERQVIEVVVGLANPARGLCLLLSPTCSPAHPPHRGPPLFPPRWVLFPLE